MKLILVRHGDAGAYTQPDHKRNLSDLGQRQAQMTGEWLKQFTIDQVISSPYNRAQQTAQILSHLPLTICEAITPNDEAQQGIFEIATLIKDDIIQNEGTVLVVCHMNIIAKIAYMLGADTLDAFALAEARVFELPFLAAGVGKQIAQFDPAALMASPKAVL